MPSDAAGDLLFGLLALQNGLIDQAKLVSAFQAWTLDRSKTLADHLIALGHLDETRRTLIDSLARLHLEANDGDAEKSLASVTVGRSTRELLRSIATPELEATLSYAGVSADDPDRTGTYQVGSASSDGQRFRVLRPHARGGLGAVFVALDSELNREVALKQILENHADDPRLRGRFLVEAEITGGLEHPGIVPVYGLGTYGNGRPYYAMRFIRGDSLKEAIEKFHQGSKTDPGRSLEFRRLLKRFTDVCNAIEYAHARGVLHRDIKPGNVIVGKHGETLVVDWGLAKALGQSSDEANERALLPSSGDGSSETLPGQALGTPAYMSPEQARGDLENLGPRSDVYSLGATLYCLLTGQAPFQGHPEVVLKAVEHGDFRRPRSLDGSIDPALEAIALKAMAADPAARYASSKALADDVDRWLADERVEAYPEPWTRSLNRWLSRHRTAVTGAAAAGLAALIGLAVVSAVQTRAREELGSMNGELTAANADLAESNRALDAQRKRAEERESQAIEAVKRFKDAIAENPELKNNPALEPLRKSLLKEPMAFFGALRERLEADGDTRPDSLDRLAMVASDHAYLINEIGGKADAMRAYEQSRAILERLAEAHPGEPRYRAHLADGHHNIGLLLRDTGRADESLKAHETARDIRAALADADPAADPYRSDLAQSLHEIGGLLAARGRAEEALDAYGRARDLQERLAADRPDFAPFRDHLATTLNSTGNLLRDNGRTDEALAALERARDILGPLAEADPAAPKYRADLAVSHNNIGNLLRDKGRSADALKSYEAARDLLERLTAEHPTVTRYRLPLAAAYNNSAVILGETGRPGEARKSYEKCRDLLQRLAEDHPDVTQYQGQLAGCQYNLGMLLAAAGQADEALGSYGQARDTFERLAADHPEALQFRSNLAACHNVIGILFRDTNRPDEALEAYGKAREIREKLAEDNPKVTQFPADVAASQNNIGVVLRELGRFDEALAAYGRAREINERLVADHPDVTRHRFYLAAAHENVGLTARDMGRSDEALAAFGKSREINESLVRDYPDVPDYACNLGAAWDNLAAIELDLGRHAEALDKIREAAPWLSKALAANPRNPRFRLSHEFHLAGKIKAERGLGREEEALKTEAELAEFRHGSPQFLAQEARLKAVAEGDEPRNNAERLALAQHAGEARQFALAARLWAATFDAEPKRADTRRPPYRYYAACAAAMAAAGKGTDPPHDDEEKARLRARALGWMTAERDVNARLLESDQPQARRAASLAIRRWREDVDLASVREDGAIAALPDGEQAAWRAFWDSVAALPRGAEE